MKGVGRNVQQHCCIIPFVLCMHISAVFQEKLDDCFAVVTRSKVQRCRVTSVEITTVHRVTMSCYQFLHKNIKHHPV